MHRSFSRRILQSSVATLHTLAGPVQVAKHGEAKLLPEKALVFKGQQKAVTFATQVLHTINNMEGVASTPEAPRYLKTKKLTKTAAHIMQILDREDVAETIAQRPVPQLRPGDVVQLRVETPENKRRVSAFRGIVMAIRRHGLQSTFRIRRFLAGVGVELLFHLYSPNIKELKVLEHRKVRRNKLYYMRDKMQDKKNKIT